MRAALLVLAIILTPAAVEACTPSDPNTWTALSFEDIQTCYDSFISSGDTIKLTPSSYDVNAGITLNGAKAAVVDVCGSTITDNTPASSSMISITEPTVAMSGGGIKITGCGTATIAYGTAHEAGFATVKWVSGGSDGQPTVITGINFALFVDGQAMYAAVNRGVVSGNKITGLVYFPSCLNQGALIRVKPDLGVSGYEIPPTYGSDDTNGDKAVYIENNEIKNMITVLDVDDEGRVVFRFNTVTNSEIIHHGDTSPGARYGEYYKNTFVSDGTRGVCPTGDSVNFQRFFSFRAGTGRVLDNTLPLVTNDFANSFEPIVLLDHKLRRNAGNWACWVGTGSIGNSEYPSPRQTGWGYSTGGTVRGSSIPGQSPLHQDPEPIYLAGNTGAGSTAGPVVADFQCGDCSGPGGFGPSCDCNAGTSNTAQCLSRTSAATMIQADREYYQQVSASEQSSPTSPFNGTTGTGYGTLANRPTTCTTGRGYYAADQGSWNTSTRKRGATIGSVADDGFQLQGVLYVCTATDTWTPSTPFTYPHPLVSGTGDGGGGEDSPSSILESVGPER
jgi:hypothetical protein